MCFHSSQVKSVNILEKRFGVNLLNENYRQIFNIPSYHLNGFSHPNMLVIPQDKTENLVSGVWGLVPQHISYNSIKSYFKESVKFGAGLNAKSEKLFIYFMYKKSSLTQRIIIPVTGFFEPHEFNKKKYPFYISRKDNDVFALAGIYTIIENILTFSILTKKASPFFESIHNIKKRQPVILDPEHEKKWLTPRLTQNDINTLIDNQYMDDELEAYAVSKDIFKPQVNSNIRNSLEYYTYPELTRLF